MDWGVVTSALVVGPATIHHPVSGRKTPFPGAVVKELAHHTSTKKISAALRLEPGMRGPADCRRGQPAWRPCRCRQRAGARPRPHVLGFASTHTGSGPRGCGRAGSTPSSGWYTACHLGHGPAPAATRAAALPCRQRTSSSFDDEVLRNFRVDH